MSHPAIQNLKPGPELEPALAAAGLLASVGRQFAQGLPDIANEAAQTGPSLHDAAQQIERQHDQIMGQAKTVASQSKATLTHLSALGEAMIALIGGVVGQDGGAAVSALQDAQVCNAQCASACGQLIQSVNAMLTSANEAVASVSGLKKPVDAEKKALKKKIAKFESQSSNPPLNPLKALGTFKKELERMLAEVTGELQQLAALERRLEMLERRIPAMVQHLRAQASQISSMQRFWSTLDGSLQVVDGDLQDWLANPGDADIELESVAGDWHDLLGRLGCPQGIPGPSTGFGPARLHGQNG